MKSRSMPFALVALLLSCSTAAATQFQGTLYYTRSAGEPNVTSLGFTYDDHTHNLVYATQHDIASLNGADGIMFAPNGNLLVTSNTTGLVYRLDRVSGQTLQSVSTGTPGFSDFHMALDPGRVKFYSSNSYYRAAGPLDTFGINPDGSINNATVTPIAGDNPNVTQLGFAPNGKVLYTDGNPNAFGSIGLFTFGAPNDVTTQLVAANQVRAAHGVIYDPYSGLWTMFGGGSVATMDPNASTNASIVASLKQSVQFVADFDQGAVDGFGHAFIAGANDITFLDYSLSHDITHPDQVIIRGADGVGDGFGNIDDLVPLVPVGVWTGATDANWATPSNWLGPVPGAINGTTNTDTATFNQNAPHSPLAIDAGRNIKNITFDTVNVNSMTIGTKGGNALLLTAGGTVQTTSTVVNPQTINCPLVLEGDYTFTSGAASAAATLTFGGRIAPEATSGVMTLTLGGINAGNNTISGILADNGPGKLAIAMAGPGVWVLSGANTYTGGTTINAGTLQLGDGISANGSVAGNITDKAMLIFANPSSQTYSGVVSGAGSLVKTAVGTLVLSGANTYTGGTTINAGTLQLGDGISANGSVSGNITDKATLVFANPNSQTYSGVISGAGSVAKTAAGTLVLSGNNSFTGGLSVQQGTLSIPTINNVGATGPIGAGPSVSLGSMGPTGTLEYTGGTASSTMPFSLAAGGSGTFQIDSGAANLSLSGVVSGSGALTKSGPGTLILAGNNTFTGGLAINAGIVQLGNSGALNATTPNAVRFGPGSTGILNLAGSGNITISSLQSNSAPGSPIVENANSATGQISTLTVNDSGTDTFAGVMRDDPAGQGVLAITKSGAGTLILTGANTYTGGTMIIAGTLQLGDGATSNGSVAGNIINNTGLVIANPSAETYSGIILGPGAVTKSAAGVLTLAGNNSFTGGLTIQQGTLAIATINYARTIGSLGANPNVIMSSSGQTATLEYTGGSASSNMPFTLATGGNSAFQIDLPAASLTLSGILSGGGNLTKAGPGSLGLAGNNSYTGSTTVNNGTLTTTTGTLGGGPLAVNGNSGAISAVTFGTSQSIASLSGTISGGGSAGVNVSAGKTLTVNQSSNTTFAGTFALTPGATAGGGGALVKSGTGSLEIDGALSLGNNSSLAISGGKLRLNIASASGTVGSGVTANISSNAVLELAGSASALGTTTPGNRVTITNTSSAAAGVLISAGHQKVGGIGGNGTTQINAGANLTADHIIQRALIISGAAGNPAKVTIDPSDSSGNPVAVPAATLLGEPSLAGLSLTDAPAPMNPFRAGGSGPADFGSGGATETITSSVGSSLVGGNPMPVPEPSTLLLIILPAVAAVARAFATPCQFVMRCCRPFQCA